MNASLVLDLKIAAEENDGLKLAEFLYSLKTSEQIRDLLGTIEGP